MRRRRRRAPAGVATALVLSVAAFAAASCGSSPPPVAHRPAARDLLAPVANRLEPSATVPPAPFAPATVGLQASLAASLGGRPGCVDMEAGGGRVAALNPSMPLTPASTQKLVVAAAALSVLGPDYRFVTRLVAPAPLSQGVASRLWLVGSGDPMLAVAAYGAALQSDPRFRGAPVTPLEWLADAAVAAGVKVVPGGVVGDDSRYSRVRYLPTWPKADETEGDVGPLSALSLDEGYQRWSRLLVPAPDPPADAAERLAELMVARGVAVGPVGPDGPAPNPGVVVASVESAPLPQIVSFMLASSDNHVAELLTREVGLRLTGDGSTASGVKAVMIAARRLGIPTAGEVMVDGSGLSPEDRITCAELLGALDAGDRPDLSALLGGLAVAGRSGTLVDRWRLGDLAGRLRAKTGWITGAASIAGSLPEPVPVRFAAIVNGVGRYSDAVSVEDQLVAAIDSYRP